MLPEQVEAFIRFFEEYLLPNQLKHGAELVGRWVSQERTEIMALWRYASEADYARIEAAVRQDDLAGSARARRQELGPLFLESRQDFLEPTGQFGHPRHKLSAAGLITNAAGEVLLVRTQWRSDTWEIPGGVVEEGEAPHAAAEREVFEETGVQVRITGLAGLYYNASGSIANLVFHGEAVGGELRPSPETPEVRWVRLTPANLGEYITRPQMGARVLDALQGAAGGQNLSIHNPSLRKNTWPGIFIDECCGFPGNQGGTTGEPGTIRKVLTTRTGPPVVKTFRFGDPPTGTSDLRRPPGRRRWSPRSRCATRQRASP